jgi:hypothetical protein
VDDEVLDGLHVGLKAGLLGRFRFKDVDNHLNDLLKNSLKDIFEGILEADLVIDHEGVNEVVAVPVRDIIKLCGKLKMYFIWVQ